MKKKNIIIIILTIILAMVIGIPISNAAGLTIAFSKSNVTVGDTIDVTVNGSGIAGKVSLSVSGSATLSQNVVWVDNSSATVKATINGEGNIKITATPVDVSDSTTAEPFNTPTAGTVKSTKVSSENNKPDSNSGTTTSEAKKSNNANLSNLGIRPNDFTGFKSGTTSYKVEVPENVSEVEVYAKTQHAKATVSGTGKKTLQNGVNNLSVVVTAEDGTKKIYTIQVTRKTGTDKEEEEKTEEQVPKEEQIEEKEIDPKGLSELKIGDLSLTPIFKTDVYEYQVKYIGEDTKLNIDAKATQEDYVVDITGNEDLKEGENIITILVSDKEGNNIATYQINVDKSLVDEEAIAKEKAQKQESMRKIILVIVIAIVVVAFIIFFMVRHRRNKRFAEEYTGVPFSGLNEDEWEESNQQWQDKEEEKVTVESLSHEELKDKYLSSYNEIINEEDVFQERARRPKHKGKRFK